MFCLHSLTESARPHSPTMGQGWHAGTTTKQTTLSFESFFFLKMWSRLAIVFCDFFVIWKQKNSANVWCIFVVVVLKHGQRQVRWKLASFSPSNLESTFYVKATLNLKNKCSVKINGFLSIQWWILRYDDWRDRSRNILDSKLIVS